jgi:hypothetical protein
MRIYTVAVAVLVALGAAGVAVAHGIKGAKTATAVSATFSASAGSVTTRTCTTADNKTITIADGRYTGTSSSSDANLSGAITLRARSVVNTTDGVGSVSGTFRIDVAHGGDTTGAFSTVYDHGALAGLATARGHDPNAAILANLSASFASATGFTSGKLGGGTSGGGAIETANGACKPAKPAPPEKSEAHGTVSAVSSSSITVAGLTCAVPSAMSAAVTSKVKQGDRAEIRCSVQNGQNTLTHLEKRH